MGARPTSFFAATSRSRRTYWMENNQFLLSERMKIHRLRSTETVGKDPILGQHLSESLPTCEGHATCWTCGWTGHSTAWFEVRKVLKGFHVRFPRRDVDACVTGTNRGMVRRNLMGIPWLQVRRKRFHKVWRRNSLANIVHGMERKIDSVKIRFYWWRWTKKKVLVTQNAWITSFTKVSFKSTLAMQCLSIKRLPYFTTY